MSRLDRLDAWLDERIGHKRLLDHALREPVVGGARWAYVFGSALASTFAVQALTGVLLMTAYAPSSLTAWSSVHYISYVLAGGWLVRGVHHFGSQAMIVLLALHVVQVATFGAYKKPREVTWWIGLGLLAVTLAFGLTGYLLPWDQRGYWATRVATNIAGTTPIAGAWVQELLQGGPEYGSLTLTRFYALHVGVLPGAFVTLVLLHLALFRKHGVTPGARADRAVSDPFFPKQLARDLAAALLVLAIVFALAWRHHGAPLDAPADPASDYPARPEWYFLPLFELLKHFHGRLEIVGTMVIPAAIAAYLVVLPLIDARPGTAIASRLTLLAPLFLGAVGLVVLIYAALRADAADGKYEAARKAADERARIAVALAMNGVPPEGPLAMLERDPEIQGRKIFDESCASCHVLGDLGDRAKATAPVLDGWGTEAWVLGMLHDPDATERFGPTPYKGEMPSMDVPPKEEPGDFTPMTKDQMAAAAAFLASQGDEPGEEIPPNARRRDRAQIEAGEAIVKKKCTACHLFKGEGDVGDTGEAPELSGYGSIAWTRAHVLDPTSPATYRAVADPKAKGHMPRFVERLSAADADLVARWTRAHARHVPLAGPK